MRDRTHNPVPASDGQLNQSALATEKKPGFWRKAFHKEGRRSLSPANEEFQPPEPSPASNGQPFDGPIPGEIAAPRPQFLPHEETVAEAMSDDAIISRYQALLEHCPRNMKVLVMLAEAHARKRQFDEALSHYQRALKIAGGKNAAMEKAIAETTQKKLDQELSRLDTKAPDYAAQSERIRSQGLERQWQEMQKDQ